MTTIQNHALERSEGSKLKTHNFVGVDLGGTKIAAAVVDVGSGAVAARQSIPTEAHAGPDAVLARMGELILSVGRAAGLAPAQIGGMRLASELVRPTVVGFLDQMLRDTNRNLRIEEVLVGHESALIGKAVAALHLHDYGSGLLLLAMRHASGEYVFNPPGETAVTPGCRLIVMGDPPSVAHLGEEAASR